MSLFSLNDLSLMYPKFLFPPKILELTDLISIILRATLNLIGFFTFFLLIVNSTEVPTGPLINLTASIKDFP